jgi:hypothetical protein
LASIKCVALAGRRGCDRFNRICQRARNRLAAAAIGLAGLSLGDVWQKVLGNG